MGEHVLSTFFQSPVSRDAAFIATDPLVNSRHAPEVRNDSTLSNHTLHFSSAHTSPPSQTPWPKSNACLALWPASESEKHSAGANIFSLPNIFIFSSSLGHPIPRSLPSWFHIQWHYSANYGLWHHSHLPLSGFGEYLEPLVLLVALLTTKLAKVLRRLSLNTSWGLHPRSKL